MASKIWVGSVSSDPTTAGNWSPSGVPADGDDIIFDGRAQADLTGADQSSIEPATIRIYTTCTIAIGTAASPWKIGALILEIGLPPEAGSSDAGPSSVVIDCTADPVTATVYTARSVGADGQSCVLLRGTDSGNKLRVFGGSVGVGAMVPAEATTWSQIDVSGADSIVYLGYGCTLTTINQQDGTIHLNAAVTTINQDAGTLITHGSGAITTVEARGRFVGNSTGTITNLNVSGSGVVDFEQSPANRTVTNCSIYGAAARLLLDNNAKNAGSTVVTFTNGIDLLKGAKSNQVECPTDITIAFSSL